MASLGQPVNAMVASCGHRTCVPDSRAVSAPKTLVGYCEPFSVAPGEIVQLMVSSLVEGPCGLEVVRLRCGDPHAGLDETVVADVDVPAGFPGRRQPVRPGSYLAFPAHP